MAIPLLTKNGAAFNPGRQIKYLSGITGVATGGNAVAKVDTNQRVHKISFLCQAVNYTGGTALATTKLTGTGNNDLTVTPTVVNGVVTSIAVVAGGTGYSTGATVTFKDATGTGFIGTVTQSGGVVSAVAVTNGGTPSPINPATMLTALAQKVSGVSCRDVSPLYEMMIEQLNGQNAALGTLNLNYTEEWRNLTRRFKANSWDLAGQSTFEIDPTISSLVSQPSLTAQIEFDYGRNTAKDSNGNLVPDLNPITRHAYTNAVAAGTMTPITTIPARFPIARVYIIGSTPGTITQLQVLQDNQTVLEATVPWLNDRYARQGFQFGQATYQNQTQTAQKTLSLNPISYFDTALLFDADQRFGDALRCKTSFELRVWSSSSQNVTTIVDYLPGGYL